MSRAAVTTIGLPLRRTACTLQCAATIKLFFEYHKKFCILDLLLFFNLILAALQKINMSKKIVIIGAGISGLSTALLLTEKGNRVTIISKAFSPNITSNRAAAFWFPYHIRKDKRGIGWCNTSYNFISR